MIPALFFGGNNEEELSTALFCEVFDSMDENTDDEEDYGFRDDSARSKKYYRYRLPVSCSLMSDEDELGESLSIPGDTKQDIASLNGVCSPRSVTADKVEKDTEKEEEEEAMCSVPDLQSVFSSSSTIAETMDNLESAGTEEERPIIGNTTFSEEECTAPSRAQIEYMISALLERYKESRD